MSYGPGTYGSQRGRPPSKKKKKIVKKKDKKRNSIKKRT